MACPHTPQVKEELCNLEVGGGWGTFRIDNTIASHMASYNHDAKYSLYSYCSIKHECATKSIFHRQNTINMQAVIRPRPL